MPLGSLPVPSAQLQALRSHAPVGAVGLAKGGAGGSLIKGRAEPGQARRRQRMLLKGKVGRRSPPRRG